MASFASVLHTLQTNAQKALRPPASDNPQMIDSFPLSHMFPHISSDHLQEYERQMAGAYPKAVELQRHNVTGGEPHHAKYV